MAESTCIVIFHGPGSSGSELRCYLDNVPLEDFEFRTFSQVAQSLSIDVVTPTAKPRSYAVIGGERCNVWADRSPDFMKLGLEGMVDKSGIDATLNEIAVDLDHLQKEHSHVFIGGFDMGGELALNLLRSCHQAVPGGIFAVGSFLVDCSPVFSERIKKSVPVLMMHGKGRNALHCISVCVYMLMY